MVISFIRTCCEWLVLPFVVASISICSSQENKITTELDGITFDSNYENGSLGSVVSSGTDAFAAQLFVESGELGDRSYWFRFRMSGVAGRSIRIFLDHQENRFPFIRIGNEAWRRMTAKEAPSFTRMTLTFAENEDLAEVAFFEPLGLAETYAAVNQIASGNPYFEAEVIGRSVLGNDVVMTTVNDRRYPLPGKRRVWLHSRAHAGEVTSTHSMLGFLEQIVDDSETGRRLREHCIFHVVPVLNVDGVGLGYTRWDALGRDPERPWCDVDIPVVQAVKREVDTFMESESPIEVALNLHSTRGTYDDTFFFKHLAPSVTPAFEDIQQRYIDAFAEATPLFENGDPQTSQLNPCLFIESYFWNNWGESVMALTHEGHYERRVTDNAYLTGDDYREMGKGMATALIRYFDLPEATEQDVNYEQWRAQQFDAGQLADVSISGTSADPDGDGVMNFEEFLVQTNPTDSTSIERALRVENGVITLALASSAVATGLQLQESMDLSSWIVGPDLGHLDSALTISADGVERRVTPLNAETVGNRYFRIQF